MKEHVRKWFPVGLVVGVLTLWMLAVGLQSPALAAPATVGGSAAVCSASPLGPASDFNLFLFGNLNQSYTDSEGRVAVGGNATLQGYGVGVKLSDSNGTRDDLVVGGNLNFTDGTVYNGNATYGGTATLTRVTFLNGSARKATPIDFAAAKTQLLSQSSSLKALAANGTTTVQYGGITLTGSNSQLNVFSLSGSALSSANNLTIKVPAGSTVLINVSGTSVQMKNFAITINGTDRQKVLFNFPDATTLTIGSIAIQGSILAPKAAVTFNNGDFNGTLVANSLTGNGEFHPYPFNGCVNGAPTATPTKTRTPTNTKTRTPSNTPTNTLTNTPSNTPVPPTNTFTPTPSNTPVPPTNTFTPTPTDTPVPPTNTFTPTPSNTPVPPTNTFTPTPTDTLTPTDTATPSNTPTNTPTPTDTATPSNTPTNTPTPTDTATPSNTPTNTPTPSNTPSLTPTQPSVPCVKITKTLSGPFRTSDGLLLTDKVVPVAVETTTSPYYFLVTIKVENCGGTVLTAVNVIDTFSNEAEPFDRNASQGSVSISPPVDAGDGFDKETLEWVVGTLAVGQEATLTVKVGGEANPAGKIEPTDGNQDIFFNGQDDQQGSASVTATSSSGTLSAKVEAFLIDFQATTCVGSVGGWESLPQDKCAVIQNSLPITKTATDNTPS